MTEETLVKWITASGVWGSGVTISNERNGHIYVAVDAPPGEEHRVIYCKTTWLKEIGVKARASANPIGKEEA